MKEDFTTAKQELENRNVDIVQVAMDFHVNPIRKGSIYFTKSPATDDKNFSLALYPGSGRFTDYANGNCSGDCISFISYICNCNNWQALEKLKDYYGLSGSYSHNQREMRSQVMKQQAAEQRKQERKQQFFTALNAEINEQIFWRDIFSEYLQNHLFEPFSSEWCDCTNELQLCEYKLDVLCASDQIKYCRMKTSGGQLPTDRYKWILDCLEILQESRRFTAIESEKRELRRQANFEVNRKPEQNRRCALDW